MSVIDSNNKNIFSFIRKTRIRFNELTQDFLEYLQNIYDNTQNILTPSSPAGQIWSILTGHFTFLMFYLEDAFTESNLLTASRKVSKFGLSRLSGHNPFRGRSAEGEILISLKREALLELPNYVKLLNKTKLKCLNNNLIYTIVLGDPYIIFKSDSREPIFVKIFEGEFEEQTVVSLGESMESFSITTPLNKIIDQYNVNVYVNEEEWEIVGSLQDLGYDQKGCIVKTGINGGLDIYFGNGNLGKIPVRGANIRIEYLVCNGSSGNLFSNSNDVRFIWEDDLEDINGEVINSNSSFDIFLNNDISFGNDSEDSSFSELINPTISKSNVLVLDKNYENEINKIGGYSYVKVSKESESIGVNNNVINMFLVPSISNRLISDNYFSLKESDFSISESEKNKLLNYFRESGKQSPSIEVKILGPKLVKYSINIVLIAYENWKNRENLLRENILRAISNYMINFKRRDRLPKSDIIKIIENIEGVDSVNVYFISEKNEKAISDGFYKSTQRVGTELLEVTVNLAPGEDPLIGLDGLGDIVLNGDEIPIISGNWYDRNNVYIENDVTSTSPSAVSIFITKYIPKS